MYNEEEINLAKKNMMRRLVIGILLILLVIAALVVFTSLRMLAASMIVCTVLFLLTFYYWSVKLMPHIRYILWLRDMKRGRHHETLCRFVSVSDGTVLRDGVNVHEMIVRVDDTEDGERMFFWDDDKKLPGYAEGQDLKIESFGNYVVNCECM